MEKINITIIYFMVCLYKAYFLIVGSVGSIKAVINVEAITITNKEQNTTKTIFLFFKKKKVIGFSFNVFFLIQLIEKRNITN